MVAVAALSLVALSTTSASAASPKFPTELEVGETKLQLNGSGLCEYGIFGINLYYAALYVESRTKNPDEIVDVKRAKRLDMHFVRKLTKKQLTKAWRAGFKANAGEEFSKFEKSTEAFVDRLYTVKSGDRLVFTALPGKGLELRFGKQKPYLIEDVAFAQLFFRCYVGEKPPTESLRSDLLGK